MHFMKTKKLEMDETSNTFSLNKSRTLVKMHLFHYCSAEDPNSVRRLQTHVTNVFRIDD